MKIFLDQFCLAAGGGESPENLRVNGQRQVQTADFLRAADAGVFARGGRTNTLSFTITREHADYGAAEAFLFAHAARLPASGPLVVVCEGGDGPQVRYAAHAAAVRTDEGTQCGITTTHVYTVVCGTITGGELKLNAGGQVPRRDK